MVHIHSFRIKKCILYVHLTTAPGVGVRSQVFFPHKTTPPLLLLDMYESYSTFFLQSMNNSMNDSLGVPPGGGVFYFFFAIGTEREGVHSSA